MVRRIRKVNDVADLETKDPTGFALASCDANGEILEIDDTGYWMASDSEARAALWASGYVQISEEIWNGTTPEGKEIYACIIPFH